MVSPARLIEARLSVATAVARAFAEADTLATLLDELRQAAADADESAAVDALITRYQAGGITLAQMVDGAHAAILDGIGSDGGAHPDVGPDQRGSSHMLLAVAAFGALAGLSALGNHSSAALTDAAMTYSLSTGSAEFGKRTLRPIGLDEAALAVNDRLAAIRAKQAAGEISAAQAAAQSRTVMRNASWSAYQGRRNEEAKQAGRTTISYYLDAGVKEHCGDCVDRADKSPWPIADAPGLPGDGSTECGSGDMCDVEYRDADSQDTDE